MMPAFVMRIIGLLLAVTLGVFAYETHYYSKTREATGTIESMVHKGRGKEMTIAFEPADGGRLVFATPVLLFGDLSGRYHHGDRVPVVYCAACYPVAKVDGWAYVYTLTTMLLVLDVIMAIVLGVSGWRHRQAGGVEH